MKIFTPSIFRLSLLFILLAQAIYAEVSSNPISAQSLSIKNETFPYRVEVWQSNLNVPWQIVFSGDNAYFNERGGAIRVVINGKLQTKPWATVKVSRRRGEGGLLGLALHPNFAQLGKEGYGKLFAAYTTEKNGKTINRLSVFSQQQMGNVLAGREEKILLDDIPGSSNHNGGTLKIGPDKLLYWSMGDIYNEDLAQNTKSYNGKILRLTLNGGIPSNNPFPANPVFSYGHRNAQGIAFHPQLGDAFIATEHGPSGGSACCRDEINVVRKGGNYGWPHITASEKRRGMIAPLLHSGTSNTWAPAGAVFVTEGEWKDTLLFATLRGSALYRISFSSLSPQNVSIKTVQRFFYGQYGRLRDIAAGPNGYYYLLTSNRDGRGRPRSNDDKILRFKAH